MNKHPDDYVFGMDVDLQDKMRAKFCPKKMNLCQKWIEEATGEEFDASKDFQANLKDGLLLCKLVNKIKEKSVKRPSTMKQPFKMRENIDKYLKACTALGQKTTDIFDVNDLYDGNDLNTVLAQLQSLGGLAQKIKGHDVPAFGTKQSEEHKREFTKEQIQAGKKIVPLQNAGSIAVEKEKGTDNIVLYSQVGQEMGKSVGGVSQQNAGSIAVEKEKGTDHIVRYGKTGQEMGKSHGGVSQQNAGSIAVEKEIGTDHIVRYGKAGQELGESVGGVSQQNEGSLQTSKENKLDSISRALN